MSPFFYFFLFFFIIISRKFHYGLLITFQQYKRGSPSSFLKYEQLNPKYRVRLLGFPVAKVAYYNYIAIKITSCLEIIGVSYSSITLLLRDAVL